MKAAEKTISAFAFLAISFGLRPVRKAPSGPHKTSANTTRWSAYMTPVTHLYLTHTRDEHKQGGISRGVGSEAR